MGSGEEERKPKVTINRAGLRAVTLASLVLSLALLVGLLAQGGLFTSDPGRPDHPDGLTTLALVLAVLAFLVQLFIFIIQTNASNAAVRRGEELNSQTHAVLGKIEAESTTTKEVLITQFNQLLDFVIDSGGGKSRAVESSTRKEPKGADVHPATAEEPDRPVTASELQEMLQEALRPRERPTFDVDLKPTPGPEDEMIIEYLRAWPSREEMEEALDQLRGIPPFALALLTRYGTIEIEQRTNGEPVGLYTSSAVPRITDQLVSEGLLRSHGELGRLALTERGRELARVLPIGKETLEAPPWFEELLTGGEMA